MSRSDRRAALVLLALVALGVVARVLVRPGMPTGSVGYRVAGGTRPHLESVATRAARLTRPLARGETIDLDRAPADELTRLPRIGPALARRIVQDRDRHGPFGSLENLQRVPGVGPTTVQALAPHAGFSAVAATPPTPPAPPWDSADAGQAVSLNTATVEELMHLPGIGPGRARAIVDDRRRHGPYRRLEDLARVRGIGPAIVARLRGRARVP